MMFNLLENSKGMYDSYSEKMHVIEDLKLIINVQLKFGQISFEDWAYNSDTKFKVTRLSDFGNWDTFKDKINDYKWVFIVKDSEKAYYSALRHLITEVDTLDGTQAVFLRSYHNKLKEEVSDEIEMYEKLFDIYLNDYWSGECHTRLLAYRVPFWLKKLCEFEKLDFKIHTIDIGDFYNSMNKVLESNGDEYRFTKMNSVYGKDFVKIKETLDKILETYNFGVQQTRFLLDTMYLEEELEKYKIKDVGELL